MAIKIKIFKKRLLKESDLPHYTPKKVGRNELNQFIKNLVASDPGSIYAVHFSDIAKLGVNPKSGFETPLGIYFYPLTPEAGRGR